MSLDSPHCGCATTRISTNIPAGDGVLHDYARCGTRKVGWVVGLFGGGLVRLNLGVYAFAARSY